MIRKASIVLAGCLCGLMSNVSAFERPLKEAPLPPIRKHITVIDQPSFLCNDSRISGKLLPTINGKLDGCGISNPISISVVSDVKINPSVTVNCRTALALANWLDDIVQPAVVDGYGTIVTDVLQYSGYACRSRNSKKGAKLSEHSFGNAIDIAAFKIGGEKISVLEGWKNTAHKNFLHRVWKGACGPFKTVLGPDADKYHQDHFHLDVAKRRNAYCR